MTSYYEVLYYKPPPPLPHPISPSLPPFPPLSLPPSLVPLQKEQLRIAIMDYLNHHSREKEKLERLQLVALKFKMFRELAKVKEKQALKDLKKIKPKSLGEDIIISIASIACTYLQGFIQFGRGDGKQGNLPSPPSISENHPTHKINSYAIYNWSCLRLKTLLKYDIVTMPLSSTC